MPASPPLHVVIVTLDNHLSGAVERAALHFARERSGITIGFHAAADWDRDAGSRDRCLADIARGDVVIATMLFLDDHIRTVLPALTARREDGELAASQPLPVVIGDRPVPPHAALRGHPRGLLEFPTHDLRAVLEDLRARGVQTVFVEGGPTLASAFLRESLADRVLTYIAPTLLGGARTAIGDIGVSTMSEARRLTLTDVERLGDDILIVAEPAPAHTPARIEEGTD